MVDLLLRQMVTEGFTVRARQEFGRIVVALWDPQNKYVGQTEGMTLMDAIIDADSVTAQWKRREGQGQ